MAAESSIAADFVPHDTPFRMVERIISFDDDAKSSLIEARLDGDGLFSGDDDMIDPEVLLEVIAQAAAAQHGYNLARKGLGREKGYLVGVREFEVSGSVRRGETVLVSIKCGPEIESLCSIEGLVHSGPRQVARAEISVWHGKG